MWSVLEFQRVRQSLVALPHKKRGGGWAGRPHSFCPPLQLRTEGADHTAAHFPLGRDRASRTPQNLWPG